VIVRVGLAVLAVWETFLGIYTQFLPRSFYDNFPTVDLTPPYSEHFLRDFGGATLGLAVVLWGAVIWPQRKLVVIALVAYLAFALPHFIFHIEHLEATTAIEAIVLVLTLGFLVLLALALLAITLFRRPKPATIVE
jgi:hypothetical protein